LPSGRQEPRHVKQLVTIKEDAAEFAIKSRGIAP